MKNFLIRLGQELSRSHFLRLSLFVRRIGSFVWRVDWLLALIMAIARRDVAASARPKLGVPFAANEWTVGRILRLHWSSVSMKNETGPPSDSCQVCLYWKSSLLVEAIATWSVSEQQTVLRRSNHEHRR